MTHPTALLRQALACRGGIGIWTDQDEERNSGHEGMGAHQDIGEDHPALTATLAIGRVGSGSEKRRLPGNGEIAIQMGSAVITSRSTLESTITIRDPHPW